MFRSEGDYELLPAVARNGDKCTGSTPPFTFKRRELHIFVVSVILNALAALWLAWDTYSHNSHILVQWKGARPLYSPLERAVSYHHQVAPSLRDRNKYFGPPDADVDKAWADLYRGTVMFHKLPANETRD